MSIFIARLCAVVLLGTTPILVLGYEYDENDSEAGAGANAAWRPFARWDSVDEASTADIHRYTTEPRYLTPMVSFIPEHSVVPSPRDFLGYTVGTEGKLTHPREEEAYFEALAAASANVNLLSMGVTEEKRNTMLVVVSSAENLTRMNEWKGYTRTLADPRAVSEAQAREVAAKGKPIMHITAGLHSPETGPPEMVMELAYRLAVSMHPGIVEIRDSVILLITPITDVDGRARVVEWYERYTKNYDACEFMPPNSPPYWGKYTYHDNNRDGVQLTQKLTTNFLNSFNEWHPVYSIDLHESVPLMYVSGGTGPYNTTLDPLVVREWQLAASWELAELQKAGLPGVWTWGYYTGWNPGYLLWITNNRNSMGRFYETFGNSHAGTFERDLSNSSFAGKKTTSRQWYRPDPPDEKVMWSLRNNTNYMQSGILASLTFTARNGSMLLYNFWQKGKNSIEKGKNEPPHAFVIPEDQEQRFRLAYLLNQLRKHGLEVHRANADFELEDGEFNEGDYIVRADQPYGNHVRNLLETQEFPSDAQWRPYDDVSWTYGLVYRVKTVAIEDAVVLSDVDMTRVEEPQAFPGSVGAGPKVAAFAVKQHGDNSMITARYRLRRHNVTASEEAFEAQGESFPLGSWIIPNRGGVRGALEDVARDCMLNFVALDEYPDVETHALDLPRIALYHNWVSTQNDGWIRYTLEQAEVPYTYINDDDIRRAGLRGHFDVIVMAHLGASLKSLIHGRDTKFGPMAYTKTRRFGAHGVLDSSRDITGGFGFRGMANLESYLDNGGTLLLMGGAGLLATDSGLLRNVSSTRAGIDTPGSAIQTMVVRRDHPIAFGFEIINHVFRVNGPVYTVPKKYDHWIVVKYGTKPLRDEEDDEEGEGETNGEDEETEGNAEKTAAPKKFMLSGFVDGKDELETRGAVIDIPRNAGGRVILYSFNPLHRHLNHGDHNYVYNALLHWNDFPEPEPKDHPMLAKD